MKQILVFPTWFLVRFVLPLIAADKDHQWNKKKPSLKDWADGSTPLNNSFSVFFWVMAICLIVLIHLLANAYKISHL